MLRTDSPARLPRSDLIQLWILEIKRLMRISFGVGYSDVVGEIGMEMLAKIMIGFGGFCMLGFFMGAFSYIMLIKSEQYDLLMDHQKKEVKEKRGGLLRLGLFASILIFVGIGMLI